MINTASIITLTLYISVILFAGLERIFEPENKEDMEKAN